MKRGDIGFFKFKVYDNHNIMLERIGVICDINKYCVFIFAVDGQLYRVNRKHIVVARREEVSQETESLLKKYAKLYKEKEELEKPLRVIERKMERIDKKMLEKSMSSVKKDDFLDGFLENLPEDVRKHVGRVPYEEGVHKEFITMLDEHENSLVLISNKDFNYPYKDCSFMKYSGSAYFFCDGYESNEDYLDMLEEYANTLPVHKNPVIELKKGNVKNQFMCISKYFIPLNGEAYSARYAKRLAMMFGR